MSDYPEYPDYTNPTPSGAPEHRPQAPTGDPAWSAEPPRSYREPEPYRIPMYENHSPKPPKKKKGGGAGKVIALALCFSLVGSALGAGGVLLTQRLIAEGKVDPDASAITAMLESRREAVQLEVLPVDGKTEMTPAQVYAANVNSTVGITTSVTTNFWGFTTTSAASGSGFIISNDGYILTNYHVIENSNTITVAMYDGTSYDAQLIGYDESNDIAVLKIEAEDLAPVVLGDSDTLNVGDSVVAIGNPLGELTFSLTAGAVSAKDREVTLSRNITMDLIQTDCAINSGNSGGALFNLYGEVVGITNAKYSSSSASEASIDNIGFAIPINSVRSIVESIITKGYIAKPYVGISVSDVTQQMQLYGVPAGVAIQSVTEDSPAAEAGLQQGDIITAVDGKALTSDELVDLVAASQPDTNITFSIYRQGQELSVTVTVGEQVTSAKQETEPVEQSATQERPMPFPFPFFG